VFGEFLDTRDSGDVTAEDHDFALNLSHAMSSFYGNESASWSRRDQMARCYETLRFIKSINAYDHSPLGNVEDCLELELAFNGEVFDGKLILPIAGQALVERAVLLGRDILRIASPESFILLSS